MTIMMSLITTGGNNSDLGPFDVLCGRDKESYNNIGNRRFRIMINMNLQKYIKCETRTERSNMILQLTHELNQFCGQFRFFKRVKGNDENNNSSTLVQLDYKQSREKIAHALRDAASQYRITKRKQQMIDKKSNTQSNTQSTTALKVDSQSIPAISRTQQSYYDYLQSSTIIFQNEVADVEELSQNTELRLSEIFDRDCREEFS